MAAEETRRVNLGEWPPPSTAERLKGRPPSDGASPRPPCRVEEDKRDLEFLARGVELIARKDSVPALQRRGCPSVPTLLTAL